MTMDQSMLGQKVATHTLSQHSIVQNWDSLSPEEQNIWEENYIEKHQSKKEIKAVDEEKEKLRQESHGFYNTQMLGYKVSHDDNDQFDAEYSNYIKDQPSKEIRIMDAAALCQMTYACDPNRAGDNLYHSYSKYWFPYIPHDADGILSERMKGFFKSFMDSGRFGRLSEKDRLKSNSGHYSLKDKWGIGTFRQIFTGNLDLLEEFDKRISRKRTGFFSMLYYRKNGEQLELAYVPAGTTFNVRDHKIDLILDNGLVNGGQGLTGMSPQHTLAIQNAKLLKKYCDSIGATLYFFGHSLGGGLAVACGLATQCETIVFNNAALNRFRNRLHNSYQRQQKSNITAFYTTRDFLSTEDKNKHNPVLKGLWKTLTPQNIGERIFWGRGEHGIEGICQSYHLAYITNKSQIEIEGI